MNVESLLPWSAPKNKDGQAVSTAAPNPAFWDAWKQAKAELIALGVTVRKVGGNWQVSWTRSAELAPRVNALAVTDSAPEVEIPMQPSTPGRVWSDEQKAIFEEAKSGSGNVTVVARAGTGKTTTIIEAFRHAPEETILYAVFNKKNQREAVSKITDPRVEVKTLHALGYAFIQRVWSGVKPDDSVEYDRLEQVAGNSLPDEVRDAIIKLVGFGKNCLLKPTVGGLIELAEERGIDAADSESKEMGGWVVARIAAVALKVIEASHERDILNRISFNDMVYLPVAMGWVRPWFNFVVVDESQDMNAPQIEMARLACKGRLWLVGDDRQAIYIFRGAMHNCMSLFEERFAAKRLTLTTTYRCPKLVVQMAAQYVPDYHAADSAPEGIVRDTEISNIITQAVIGDAILSRINAPLMPLCLRLLRQGIPARIEGRDVGKMLLSIIKKLKAKSVPDFVKRVQTWGDKQIARAGRSKNMAAKVETIKDQVDTLIALAEGAANVGEIESRTLSLFQNSDDRGVRPAVVLSSTHKAKGLEWERVFVLRETYLRKGKESREEENLLYVAITRSKAELVLCYGQEDGK